MHIHNLWLIKSSFHSKCFTLCSVQSDCWASLSFERSGHTYLHKARNCPSYHNLIFCFLCLLLTFLSTDVLYAVASLTNRRELHKHAVHYSYGRGLVYILQAPSFVGNWLCTSRNTGALFPREKLLSPLPSRRCSLWCKERKSNFQIFISIEHPPKKPTEGSTQ